MPVLMAQWLPLMREAFRNPASSPSSAPQGQQFRQRLQAAGRDRAGAVADALSALQKLPDRLVGLEALEFLVGRQVWVRIAEADDEFQRFKTHQAIRQF